jgi:hypothetical protein
MFLSPETQKIDVYFNLEYTVGRQDDNVMLFAINMPHHQSLIEDLRPTEEKHAEWSQSRN